MNKRFLTLLLALVASIASMTAATVEINSYNFPDVRFRAYLKTAYFNSNGDNKLTDEEIKEADMLEVNEMGITNLKGIEFFTSMWFLDCSDNDLQSLDVSKNTSLGFLACYNNKLTALDLSKNTALSELDCFLNQIKGESMDALIASLPQGTDCEFVASQTVTWSRTSARACRQQQPSRRAGTCPAGTASARWPIRSRAVSPSMSIISPM